MADAPLLGPLDEVVDQHAEATVGAGLEGEHDLLEVIEPVEPLDHDALGPKVVAPDLLDELCVVHPFDEDAARVGHAGLVRDRDRTGGGLHEWCLRAFGRYERDDAPVDDEPAGQQPHGTLAASPVAEQHDAWLRPYDEAHEPGRAMFDDSSWCGLDDRVGLARPARSVEVGEAGQDPGIRIGHCEKKVPSTRFANADPSGAVSRSDRRRRRAAAGSTTGRR